MATIRDRFWVWAHQAGSHNGLFGLTTDSIMSPVEGAHYLGVPNLIMVSFRDLPLPPFDHHALAMRSLDNVIWSIVGDAGSKRNDEQTDLPHVLDIASKFDHISGAIMDDFFVNPGGRGTQPIARWTVDDVNGFADQLHAAPRPLDLWCVLYDHQLDLAVADYLQHIDVVNFWTWQAKHLDVVADNLAKAEALAPGKRRVLGCYVWDFGDGKPMPLDVFKRQCEQGLKWLRAGRIDGMVFLATCVFDLGLDTVEWLRDWIAQVGDEAIS